MNHGHGVDHVADGRLAVARYIHDAGDVPPAADQESNREKRERKLTEKCLQYQIFLLEERYQKLNAKWIRKSTEIKDLLLYERKKVAVEECINQFIDVFDVFAAADKEYKKLKQMNVEDDQWLENIDYWVCSFKHRIYNWLTEAGREIHGDGKASSKSESSKSCSVKASSSGSSRSVKAKEIEEKAELSELQANEVQNEAEVLKVKDEIAGTKAKMEIYRCLEEQAENQSNTPDDREDRSTFDVAIRNLGWRSRSKEVEAVKLMSMKEDYMSFQLQ